MPDYNSVAEFLDSLKETLGHVTIQGKKFDFNFDKSAVRNTPFKSIDDKLTKVPELFYPEERGKYYTKIKISEYQRSQLQTVGDLKLHNSVYLPLPMNLVDQHQVHYDETDIGFGMGAIIDQFGTGGAAVAAGAVADIASTVINTVTGGGGGGAAGAAGSATISSISAGARVAGYTPNEYVTILLRGPKYKRHTLKWKFSPDEFKESESLRKILWVLNNSMAPGMYASGLLFTFPKVFEIAYYPNPGYLYKFKPAVCEALLMNYSGGGSPAFYREKGGSEPGGLTDGTDNAPESIEIEMHLIELEYWLYGDFKDTNDPYDGGARQRTDGYWGGSGS